MSTKFFYAVIMTAASAAFQLILFFTGLQTERLATGKWVQWLGLLIPVVVLYIGIKAVQEESPGHALTYGQRVGAGVLISLYSGLMSAVYTFVHFKFINTEFADYTIEMIRTQWAARGLTPSQMDAAEKITRAMLGPGVQAIIAPVFAVLIGTIVSLIVAALLANKPQPAAQAAPTQPS